MGYINLELLEGDITSDRYYRGHEIQFLLNLLREQRGLKTYPYHIENGDRIQILADQLTELGKNVGRYERVEFSIGRIGIKLRRLIDFLISQGELSMDELYRQAEIAFPSLPTDVQEEIQRRYPR